MFEKGELEKILGVKKINNQDLKTRLIHLMGNVIEVPDDSIKQGFKLVTLSYKSLHVYHVHISRKKSLSETLGRAA